MSLSYLDYLNGFFSLIFVLVSFSIGLKIISKYFKYKQKDFLYFGLSWIGISEGWWPASINFILAITNREFLSEEMYFIIANLFLPWLFLIWIIAITDLMYKKQQKLIVAIFVVFAFIYNFLLFYYIYTDPSKIGELVGPFDVQYRGVVGLFLVFIASTTFIAGMLFARHTMKSYDPELKRRGKFIALAFLSWFIAAFADVLLPLSLTTVLIIRILLISSAIEYYFGFFLPNWLKKSEWEDSTEEKDEVEEFLKMLEAKPKRITEEEILYHKEKKICLVCKGKISRRKKHICPKCDILYCLRCSVALSSLENMCWVCETTIDPSKSIKKSETTEEIEIKMSKKPQKKLKTDKKIIIKKKINK